MATEDRYLAGRGRHGARARRRQSGHAPLDGPGRPGDGRRRRLPASGCPPMGRWYVGGRGPGARHIRPRFPLGAGPDRPGRRRVPGGRPAAGHPSALRGPSVRRDERRRADRACPRTRPRRHGSAGGDRLPRRSLRSGAPRSRDGVGDSRVECAVRPVARTAVAAPGDRQTRLDHGVRRLRVGRLAGGPGGCALHRGAGVLFCELRRRSGSLLAPMGLHWAVNALGYLAGFLLR